MSLMMFSMVFVMVVMSIASGERIAQVINQKSDLVSPENGIKEIKNGQIDFEDVYFEYTNIQDEANYVLEQYRSAYPKWLDFRNLGGYRIGQIIIGTVDPKTLRCNWRKRKSSRYRCSWLRSGKPKKQCGYGSSKERIVLRNH